MTVSFDEIQLSAATFRKVGALGELAEERFALGSAAAGRFIGHSSVFTWSYLGFTFKVDRLLNWTSSSVSSPS